MFGPVALIAQTVEEFESVTIAPLSEKSGLPRDQVRFILHWFLNFPVCWCIHFWAKGATARHLVNIVIGITCTFYFYGYDSVHVFLMSLITYLLMKYAPRDRSQNYIMVYTLSHLSYLHLEALFFNFGGYDLGVTNNMMCTTLRMHALGYSYFDGNREQNKLTER